MNDKLKAGSRRGYNPFLDLADMLPLDVGHVNALRRFNSPFLDGRQPGLDDVAFAYIVCTRSLDDFMFLGNSGKMPALFVEYRAHFARIGVDRAILELRAYLDAGVSVRAVIEALDEGCGPAAPPPPSPASADRN
jgi:hypothetical protein